MNTKKASSKLRKGLSVLGIVIGIVAVLAIVVYAMVSRLVQWEEDSVGVGRKEELNIDTSDLPTLKPTLESRKESPGSLEAKGKITVTFIKDKGAAFDNGEVRLVNPAGKTVQTLYTGPDGTSGVVVFDQVPSGTYTVVGGRKGEIAVRSVSKSVFLAEGEFANVTLKLYIDTPVAITVTVTGASGSPIANRSFNLIRPRGDEGDEVFSVSTDSSGTFSTSGVYPDDRWTLKDGEVEVARFKVEPNGQNQTINVTTNSN